MGIQGLDLSGNTWQPDSAKMGVGFALNRHTFAVLSSR
jgi:hypothetical protein